MATLICKRINRKFSRSSFSLSYKNGIAKKYISSVCWSVDLSSTFCNNKQRTTRVWVANSSMLQNVGKAVFRTFSAGSTSNSNTTNDNNSIPVATMKLPRRVVKRLQKQGISEVDFLKKLDRNETEFPRASFTHPPEKTLSISKEKLEDLLKNMSTESKDFLEVDSFPSDMKKFRQWEKQQVFQSAKPKLNPTTTSVILFPGQGSQFVRMGRKLLEFPGVRDLYDEASSVLGYDLLNLCIQGPKAELDKTIFCQPAVMVTSLAAIEKVKEEHPQAVENCIATAGFSVGEFSALVFAGVVSFPDAIKLVKVRAEAMQKASERISSGMLTVFLAHDSRLKLAIQTAKEYCTERRHIDNPICCVANYLFPECKVLAGHEEALEFIAINAKEFNILRTKRLPVSGAFHTQLMESAIQPLCRALDGLKIGNPKIPVYSNVTSHPYHVKTNYSHMLSQQLIKPVMWEQIMHEIYNRKKGEDFPNTYEVGPGIQLGTLLKQINLQAHKNYHSMDV